MRSRECTLLGTRKDLVSADCAFLKNKRFHSRLHKSEQVRSPPHARFGSILSVLSRFDKKRIPISMVCTEFNVRRTFLPQNSMCGAHLCAHSPCPHPIALPTHHTPPPHPFSAPELLQQQLLLYPLHLQHLLPFPHFRPLEYLRIEECCSWSSTTIQLLNPLVSAVRLSAPALLL